MGNLNYSMPEFYQFNHPVITMAMCPSGSPVGPNACNIWPGPASTVGSWMPVNSHAMQNAGRMIIAYGNGNTAATMLWDLAKMNAADSAISIIFENFLSNGAATNGSEIPYIELPLGLDSGDILVGRGRVSSASITTFEMKGQLVNKEYYSEGPFYVWNVYGTDPSISNGTLVDPGGVADTFGSWVTVASATHSQIKYIIVGINNNGNSGMGDSFYELELAVGDSGVEVPIITGLTFKSDSVRDGIFPANWPFFIHIPSSVRIAARAKSTNINATDRLFRIGLLAAS